jgi:hypothetical protein
MIFEFGQTLWDKLWWCWVHVTSTSKKKKELCHHLFVQWTSISLVNKQRVCHNLALPFTLKSILMQKENYKNSNISPCKNILFKKILSKKPKSFKIS